MFHRPLILFVTLTFFWVALPLASVSLFPRPYPVYLPEISIIAFTLVIPFLFDRGTLWAFFRAFAVRSYLIFSFVLMCAVFLSFYMNPLTWQGGGIIKSHYLFPIFGGLLMLLVGVVGGWKLLRVALIGNGVIIAGVALGGALLGHGITYDGRLRAWLDSPNQLAFLLAIPAVLALAQVYHFKSRLFLFRFGGYLAAFLLLWALLLTHSLGALVAVGSATAWYMVYGVGRQKVHLAALLIVVVFLGGLITTGKGTALLTEGERSSLASRFMIWEAAVTIGRDHPLFGIGPGRFQELYLSYQPQFPLYLEWAVPHPHNLLLSMWLSSGIIGLLSGVLVHVLLALTMIRVAARKDAAAAERLLPLLVLVILGFVDTPFSRSDVAYWIFVGVAWLFWESQRAMRKALPLSRSRK